MNLDEAIETGQQYRRDGEMHDLQDFEDFIDLGIEAMKRIMTWRKGLRPSTFKLLPGETKE